MPSRRNPEETVLLILGEIFMLFIYTEHSVFPQTFIFTKSVRGNGQDTMLYQKLLPITSTLFKKWQICCTIRVCLAEDNGPQVEKSLGAPLNILISVFFIVMDPYKSYWQDPIVTSLYFNYMGSLVNSAQTSAKFMITANTSA